MHCKGDVSGFWLIGLELQFLEPVLDAFYGLIYDARIVSSWLYPCQYYYICQILVVLETQLCIIGLERALQHYPEECQTTGLILEYSMYSFTRKCLLVRLELMF